MKSNNILVLALVIIVSFIFALFVPAMIFKSTGTNKIETVPTITSNFQLPSNKFFNNNSVDLTPYTQITSGNNTNPFVNPNNQN